MTRTAGCLFFGLFLMMIFCADSTAQTAPGEGTQLKRKILVGVLNDPPYIIKNKNGQWSGLNVDIWRAIAAEQKMDYELKEMEFQDLLDALRDKKLDISIDAFYVTAERLKFLDYSVPFGNGRLAVATLPEKIRHPWWEAIRIFFSWSTLKIVILLCAALCLLGFLFWLIERKTNPDHFGGGVFRGIGSGIYWVGSTLASGVCFGVALKSLPARFLGLIWMLVCAIALSALIASLTASLTARRSMIDNIGDDALRRMHLGGVKGSAESAVLKSLDGDYILYDNEEQALRAVAGGKIDGFLYDEITLDYYKLHEYKNKINVYPTKFKKFSFAFGLPRNSTLRPQIDFLLLSLMEKPEWTYILRHHNLEENFQGTAAFTTRRGREW